MGGYIKVVKDKSTRQKNDTGIQLGCPKTENPFSRWGEPGDSFPITARHIRRKNEYSNEMITEDERNIMLSSTS
jgi:hypothetical protein